MDGSLHLMSLEVASASLSQCRIAILLMGLHPTHSKLQCAPGHEFYVDWRSNGLPLDDQNEVPDPTTFSNSATPRVLAEKH